MLEGSRNIVRGWPLLAVVAVCAALGCRAGSDAEIHDGDSDPVHPPGAGGAGSSMTSGGAGTGNAAGAGGFGAAAGWLEVVAISAGQEHTCAVLGIGSVACWGRNENGQLGNGSNASSHLPVTVPESSGATAISRPHLTRCPRNYIKSRTAKHTLLAH